MKTIIATTAALALSTTTLMAAPNVETPADVIHPNIHDKVGRGDGTNANPNGVNENGGNIHGIGNNPGKGGGHPNDDGVKGQSNELETMHGGIGAKNKNAN